MNSAHQGNRAKRNLFFKFLSNSLLVLLATCLVGVVTARLCGIQFRAVLTSSMEPDLPVGSLIVIVPTAFEDIQVGDDITYVRDKNLTIVTHRVISKDETNHYLTTQGIQNNAPDVPTMYDNVIGVARFHIPVLGNLVIWLDTTWGKIIAFATVAALVLISLLFDSDGKKEKKGVEA